MLEALHGDHDTCVLVPTQERVIAVLCGRLRNVCSASHEFLVKIGAREPSCNGCIHWFHDFKVGREKNIKIALVNLDIVSIDTTANASGCVDLQEA